MPEDIGLGDRAKDRISGLSGIVIAITDWLYGCRRITVLPESNKDCKPADCFTVDEPQLDCVKRAAILVVNTMAAASRPSGGRHDPARKTDPS